LKSKSKSERRERWGHKFHAINHLFGIAPTAAVAATTTTSGSGSSDANSDASSGGTKAV